jgi:hypothetical protein
MNIVQRVQAPTPKFFRVIRTIGLTLAAASAAVIAAPVALPAAVITIAGYVAVAGTVATAICQSAVDDRATSLSGNGGGAAITDSI